MSDLFVDSWGAGTPAVLVHGSPATWAKPSGEGEDFCVTQKTLPGSWILVRTSSAIRTGASGRCSRLPAASMRPCRSRCSVEGAGHEVQFAGRPLNEALLALWRSASPR